MNVGFSAEEDVDLDCLKLRVIKDLRDMVCLSEGEEAGQSGCNFSGAVADLFDDEGVRDGTQKEGKVAFADWGALSRLLVER